MIIYEVRNDSNTFQSFLPKDEAFWSADEHVFDGRPKSRTWLPPEVYSHNPTKDAGDFWHFGSGTLVATPECTEVVRDHFEMAGELLPLSYQGLNFTLLNVLECPDCLDSEKCEWVFGKTSGRPIRINRYAFYRNRLSESTIFKIPFSVRGMIFTVEGMKDPDDEFKHVVETSRVLRAHSLRVMAVVGYKENEVE